MKRTQKQRVLYLLQVAGSRGITAADLASQPTPDGGPPILRLAARTADLRDDGHRIVHAGQRDACRVYRLLTAEVEPARRGTVPTDPLGGTDEAAGGPYERLAAPAYTRHPRPAGMYDVWADS